MNKIHRTVWSHARQAFVVTHEGATSRSKRSGSTLSAVSLLVMSAMAAPAMAAPVDLMNTNDAVHIYGLDNSGTPLQVTGVSVEPYQGDPFTIIYAQDNSGTPVTTKAEAAAGDVASIVVNDGGLGSTSSSATYVKLQAGSASTLTVSGTGITAVGGIDNSGGGITNAGAISGATTINASGTITGGNLSTGGTLGVSGLATLSGGATVTGTTNINTTGAAATNIGNASSTTSLNSATNNIGVSSGYATANNIGTNNAFASINSMGNSNTGTTVTATGGNSALSVANGTASLRSGSGATASGFTTTSTAQTLSATPATLATQLNNVGDAASRQNIAGATYVNRLEGNTLINGNTYINGTLAYTSNTSATTTVTSGASVIGGATQTTNGQMSIANATASGAVVDGNGNITTGIVGQTTASLTLTNGIGNTHGLVVTESQATLSGGVHSTSLTLNDNGATFSNSATGAPVQVHGVADGTQDFDAVNYRQLKQIAAGVAGVSAMANIPQVDQNKTFAVGVGLGNFQSQSALALGASYRMASNVVAKASVSTTNGSGSKNTVYGVGAGMSW